MTVATVQTEQTAENPPQLGIPFPIVSRPCRKYANVQSVTNILNGSGSFAPIQLPASGYVRKLSILFSFTMTFASAGAVVAGDGPWNLISAITLTDAQGQPITQPISGYNLYLINKYFSRGGIDTTIPRAWGNPHLGPEFAYAVAGGTAATATFRLELDLEEDPNSGYGSIPNLDSNASLQLRIDYAQYTAAFTGTTPSAATLTARVDQHYWAPVNREVNGRAAETAPVGVGDYVETRIETQTVSAATENIVNVVSRGGLIKGQLIVSRAAGTRTAFTAASPVGVVLDNIPIDEGILFEAHQDMVRREYGNIGTDLTTSYAPLTAGVLPGLDRGVLVHNFGALSGGRDSWLPTRPGSQLQLKLTPGASATTLEIITLLAQTKNLGVFYGRSARD